MVREREGKKDREGERDEQRKGEMEEQKGPKKRKGKESYKPCEGWAYYSAAPLSNDLLRGGWGGGQDWEYPHSKPLAFNTLCELPWLLRV